MKLLYFKGPKCHVCKALDRAGHIKRFASEFPDVRVEELNAEDGGRGAALANVYNVMALPTLVVVDPMGAMLARHEGGATYGHLLNLRTAAINLKKFTLTGTTDVELPEPIDDPEDDDNEIEEDELGEEKETLKKPRRRR